MKKETKELIDWIKKQINISKTDHIDKAWNGEHEAYNADYKKAMRFLDSLPEIESHLTRGGYIQDVNETPCCDGDKVLFSTVINPQGLYKGTLEWEPIKHHFIIFNNDEALPSAKEITFNNIDLFRRAEW